MNVCIGKNKIQIKIGEFLVAEQGKVAKDYNESKLKDYNSAISDYSKAIELNPVYVIVNVPSASAPPLRSHGLPFSIGFNP